MQRFMDIDRLDTDYELLEAPHRVRVFYSYTGKAYKTDRLDYQNGILLKVEMNSGVVNTFIDRWFGEYYKEHFLYESMMAKRNLLKKVINENDEAPAILNMTTDIFTLGVTCRYVESLVKVDEKILLNTNLLPMAIYSLVESIRMGITKGNLAFYREQATEFTGIKTYFTEQEMLYKIRAYGKKGYNQRFIRAIIDQGIILRVARGKGSAYVFSSKYIRNLLKKATHHYLHQSKIKAIKDYFNEHYSQRA